MDTDALISEIYEASLRPNLWHGILDKVRRHVHAKHAVISIYDRKNPHNHRLMTAGATPQQESLYLERYMESDVQWLTKVFGSENEGIVVSSEDFLAKTGLDRSQLMGIHTDFFRKANISEHAYSLPIHNDEVISAFSVHRETEGDYFAQEQLEWMGTISQHLRRSLRIYHRIRQLEACQVKLLHGLERCAQGVILLNGNLGLAYANEEAGRILDQHPALSLGRYGRLKAAIPEEDATLSVLLGSVLHDHWLSDGRESAALALHADGRPHPLKLSVLPLAATGLDPALGLEGISLAVFVTDVDRTVVLPDTYLRQTYGLTEAECEVALALANGATIVEIAAQRGTSESTVRWQVKCLLQKTQSSSQAELMRVLVSLALDFGSPP